MKKSKVFSLPMIAMLALLSACGGRTPEAVVSTSLVVSGVAGLANTDGGLVLIGTSSTGRFVRPMTSETVTLDLKKGAWSFQALAWSGPGNFEGTVRCGELSYNLDKDSETLALSLSQANCNSATFGGAVVRNTAGTDFLPLEIQTCGYLARDYLTATLPTDPGALNPYCEDLPGKDRSFKVILNPVATSGSTLTSAPMESSCLSGISPGSFYLITNLQIPAMDLPFTVVAYPDSTCSAAPDPSRSFAFNFGLHEQTLDDDGFYSYYNGNHVIFLDSLLCTGQWLNNLPFAQGPHDTTTDAVNYICTVQQLQSLDPANTNGQYSTAHLNSTYYRILNNLDLAGSALQIGNAGTAASNLDIDGEGVTISNGVKALFAWLENTTVEELTLDNFHINESTGSMIGILADKITSSSTSKVELRKINITNSSLTLTGSTHTSFGIIGSAAGNFHIGDVTVDLVDITATGGSVSDGGIFLGSYSEPGFSAFPELWKISILDSTIDTVGTNIGGMVGHIDFGTGNSGRFHLGESFLYGLQVFGVTNVGGMTGGVTGSGINAELGIYNATVHVLDDDVTPGIYGITSLGGIIGNTNKRTRIESSEFLGTIERDVISAGNSVGGLVGRMEMGTISESNAYVRIFQVDDSNAAADVGGLGGHLGMPATSSVEVINSYANVDIEVYGWEIGGLVGKLEGHTSQRSNIEMSLAVGSITTPAGAASSNSQVGGLVGFLNGTDLTTSISHVDVDGYFQVGGYVGKMTSNADIINGYATGLVSSAISAASDIGGLIGHIDSSNVQYALYDGIFSPNDPSCSGCGAVVGRAFNSANCANISNGSSYSFIGSATEFGIGVTATNCTNSGAGEGLNQMTNFIQDPMQFEVADGTLKFVKWWELKSPLLTEIGNARMPFALSSAADWNAIAENPVLLAKSFELTNDIDFGHGTFVPLGGATSMPFAFRGNILGEGFTLSGITLTNAHCGGNMDCGLIRKLGESSMGPPRMAYFGRYESPLYIDDVIFDLDSASVNNVGIIGRMVSGQATVRVSNAIYTLSTGTSVGGLVGYKSMDGPGRIDESSFSGTIATASGFQYIGGLAGAVGSAMGSVAIKGSFADVTFVGDGDAVGGLIGYVDLTSASGTQPMEISDNYVYFNGIDTHTTVGGLFGKIDGSNAPMQTGMLVAHINTADTINATFGSLINSASYSGNLSHRNTSSQIFAIVPNGQTVQQGTGFMSWTQFLQNIDPYDSRMVLLESQGATKQFWEFPPGTLDY